jgi:hypothetical protein
VINRSTGWFLNADLDPTLGEWSCSTFVIHFKGLGRQWFEE